MRGVHIRCFFTFKICNKLFLDWFWFWRWFFGFFMLQMSLSWFLKFFLGILSQNKLKNRFFSKTTLSPDSPATTMARNLAKPDIVSFDFFSKIFGANNISSALDEKKNNGSVVWFCQAGPRVGSNKYAKQAGLTCQIQ